MNKYRILILEDIDSDAELVEHELHRAKIAFSSRRMKTKEAFLRELKRFTPDFILSDYALPQFDGMAALKLVKKFDASIPFIIVTGSMNEEVAVECMKAGAADYVIKQHLVRLGPAVKGALGKKRAREEKERAEETLRVSHHFLEIANRHTKMNTLLEEFTAEIKELTGCDAAGIRILDEEGNIPYQAYVGFSQKFYESESPLSIKSDQCMCINVIKGDTDRNLPYYTEGGSFYMNGTTRFLGTVSEEQKGRTRNVCNQFGYESVALVPIRQGERILGLIHIADRKENMVPLETVAMLEEISAHLSTAIQRMQIEEALAESEKRFRAIFDKAIDGILLADSENKKFHTANRTICQMLGYSLEEVQNLNVSDIHPAEDLPYIVEQFEKQSRGEISLAPDLPVKRKDGSVFYADVNSSPISLAGKTYLMGIFRDITERKRAEEALERLRRQNELILSSAGEGIFGLDLQGDITFVNLAAASMLGYEADELIGESHHEAVHHARPDGSPYPDEECPIYRTSADGLVHHETGEMFWGKDGTSLPVEYTSSPILEGGEPAGAVVVFKDISERIQAEKVLKESEERYRDLIENANDLIQSVGPDGRILFTNRIWRETLGYSEEEISSLSVFDIVHPESREHCMEVFRQVLSREKVDKVEVVFVARDGKNITVEGSVNCRIEKGEPISIRGILRDVTEYRTLENQLRQSQKLEAVGRLAGGIAHDFNNMLTVITGYSEYLLSSLNKGDSTYNSIEEIKKAGYRAGVLTQQLLAFSRKQILQPEVLDLNTQLTNIEKMLRRIIGEDIDLVLVTDPALGRVEADPGQIDQIIMNLAVNARDAMPEGGKLTIETANVELDEVYAKKHVAVRSGPYAMLAVSDTGMGMDLETQSRIFEPFFTTKEEGKGTGLGLPTVYGIVKQSGGNIWVYSEPGKGTTFKIYLPRVEKAAESVEEKEAPSEVLQGKETILLVEDEEMVRDLARLALVESGYTVLEAGNGVEALQIFEHHEGPIHLVLTDVVMPQMSGRELTERITILKQEVKLLYMSGYTDNAIQRHGILSPGINFIQKPFAPTTLLRKVREVLEGP